MRMLVVGLISRLCAVGAFTQETPDTPPLPEPTQDGDTNKTEPPPTLPLMPDNGTEQTSGTTPLPEATQDGDANKMKPPAIVPPMPDNETEQTPGTPPLPEPTQHCDVNKTEPTAALQPMPDNETRQRPGTPPFPEPTQDGHASKTEPVVASQPAIAVPPTIPASIGPAPPTPGEANARDRLRWAERLITTISTTVAVLTLLLAFVMLFMGANWWWAANDARETAEKARELTKEAETATKEAKNNVEEMRLLLSQATENNSKTTKWTEIILQHIQANSEEDLQKEIAQYRNVQDKYQEWLNKYPDDQAAKKNITNVLSNWGAVLDRLADIEQDPGKKQALLEDACKKFDEATQCDASYAIAWSNWGGALDKLADIEQDPGKKQALWKDACKKSEKATQRDANIANSWNNWGVAFLKLAEMEQNPQEMQALLQDACKKFEEATNRDANLADAWYSWGGSLLRLSVLGRTPEEKQKFLENAKEKCLRSERIRPETGSYNLACIAALQGDKAACRKWLEKSEGVGVLPKASDLREDKVWDSVRDEAWFVELLARLEERERAGG